jgi:hypothetical protein
VTSAIISEGENPEYGDHPVGMSDNSPAFQGVLPKRFSAGIILSEKNGRENFATVSLKGTWELGRNNWV